MDTMIAEMSGHNTVFIVLLLMEVLAVHGRIWETMYLDHLEHCSRLIRNDDMALHDTYVIMSDDSTTGAAQLPFECALAFNFGDRYVGVSVERWHCEARHIEPFINVYDSCDSLRTNLVASINCSSDGASILPVFSSGSCLSLYHYRGESRAEYFFKVIVTAEEEIISFPAGGVAAVLVLIILAVMVLIKFVCVVTGYENRLPVLNLDPAEERQIIESASQAIHVARRHYHMTAPAPCSVESATSADNLLEEEPQFSAEVVATEQGHRVLRVTHSNGSSSGQPTTSTSEFHYDFVNAQVVDRSTPVAPSLNRFPSFKGASIWRSK